MSGGKARKNVLKIVSLFVAIIAWLFITYTENQQMDYTVSSIDIGFVGEDKLNAQGYMVVNKPAVSDASVVIRGRRRDIIGVMDNISATVDVSGALHEGTHELKPSYYIPSSAVYISKNKTIEVEVDVEKIKEKEISVFVHQEGAEENEEFIVESKPQREKLTIRGSQEDLETIERAAVYVDVSEAGEKSKVMCDVVFEDTQGAQVLNRNDIFDAPEQLEIENSAYEKHTLSVELEMPYELLRDYNISAVEQTVSEVDVGVINALGTVVDGLRAYCKDSEFDEGTKEYHFEIDAPRGIYVPHSLSEIIVKIEAYKKDNTHRE